MQYAVVSVENNKLLKLTLSNPIPFSISDITLKNNDSTVGIQSVPVGCATNYYISLDDYP